VTLGFLKKKVFVSEKKIFLTPPQNKKKERKMDQSSDLLNVIGKGKYANKAHILQWMKDEFSVDTHPIATMTRPALIKLAHRLNADRQHFAAPLRNRMAKDDSDDDSDGREMPDDDSDEDGRFEMQSFTGALNAIEAPPKPLKASRSSRATRASKSAAAVSSDSDILIETHTKLRQGRKKM
jgi:hypothetical protein